MIRHMTLVKALAFASVLTLAATAAGAEVMIDPRRVEFSPRDRSAELRLFNTGTERQTFRLNWIQFRMLPSGELVEAKPGEAVHASADMVRFAPRQVTLDPGERQTVRLSLRRPADLAPGEYVTHLNLATDQGVSQSVDQQGKGSTVELFINYGHSVPVVVRHGAATAEVSITGARTVSQDGQPHMAVDLTRKGNSGVHGSLLVRQGRDVIGQLNGIALYREIERRQVLVPLSRQAAGPVTVDYVDSAGKPIASASAR